jgi:outer membrane lipoprotein-sorting protein
MKRQLFILFILSFLSTGTADPENINPTEIVKRADDLLQGQSFRGTYEMRVVTPNWTRTLELKVYSENKEKTFIRILSPAKEAGIGTLRIKNEMWNYLPNVERIIKIPPSMMLQPWMGSDFANDDLVNESSIVDDYTHTLIKEETSGEDKAFLIRLDPKPEAPVIWGKIIMLIREDAVPLREEYYDERGKLIKVLTYSDIGTVSDRVIPRVWTMTSQVKAGNFTEIRLNNDVEYNVPIDPDIFTIPYLKRVQ